MSVDVPGLSTVVYRSDSVIHASPSAPSVSLSEPTPSEESQGRIHVRADVGGSSFYEVTFYAKHGDEPWRSVGTDDSAPYQVYDDVSSELAGTKTMYRAVVLDNAGHSSVSKIQQSAVPAPELTIEFPADGWRVRDTAEIRAVADPERADHVVTFERSIDGGAWTDVGTDDSSPVYTLFDDLSALDLAEGTPITYRATLHYAGGGTVSAEQTVTAASPTPYETATLHYLRPAGDYGDPPEAGWGLHMWGDAVDPAILPIDWAKPWPRSGVTDGWADYVIPLVDDTKPVNFIMHLPSGDTVPTTREPGGNRSFVPLQANEVWIVQGDPTVYTSQPNAP
jgi:hypothetical protein